MLCPTIYCDGACSGNPGPAAFAFIVYDQDGREIARQSGSLGPGTNQLAELTAIARALEWTKANQLTGVGVFTDSDWSVKAINGEYAVKASHLKPLVAHAQELARLTSSSLSWTPREMNQQADALARAALIGEPEFSPHNQPLNPTKGAKAMDLSVINGFVYVPMVCESCHQPLRPEDVLCLGVDEDGPHFVAIHECSVN